MLPTYVIFFAVVGTNNIVADVSANPTLSYVGNLMPLPAWGGLFLTCSAIMLAAMLLGRRLLYRFALRMCALSMAVWAVFIILASLEGAATPFAAAWSAFVGIACLASDRSLAAREV
jgi:hypothetical protein